MPFLSRRVRWAPAWLLSPVSNFPFTVTPRASFISWEGTYLIAEPPFVVDGLGSPPDSTLVADEGSR